MALISFAPLRIPLKRRIQTLAVLFGVFIAFLAHVTGLVLWLVLFLSKYWPIAIFYATIIIVFDRDRPSQGGRRFSVIRNLAIWRYFCDYFPIKLVKTAHLDGNKNYIFGFHPHGIITAGAFGNFATEGTDFSHVFPGIKPYLLTLKILFKFPFFRDFFMGFGICDVSKASIRRICEASTGGNAAIIIIGGAAESLDAHPGSCTLTLKDRKGFIRMALQTGANLVPVYSFGENELYNQANNPRGSLLRRLQDRIRRWLTFAPVLFYGRGIFQYNFGFLPFRRKITTVVGAPIQVVKRSNPTPAEVNRLHQLYVKRLKELFDRHKNEHSDYPNATLEIL